ncbi:DUF2487 family protein [Paenibacillus sp. 481]|uniref:DUF2487 family protein n=1 Tax=Paenibacillus sp. 481 TaxID=2835869 RepID=UPI001E5ACF24|nr:DUF2487 family protein [Paenibacillus sp. 481]UHA72981.1 DUF2487 family protein [Paenibacillus sp. 481]
MKFSELTKEQWEELQPYLDTAILPVTGLIGKESPIEAVEYLERLRDWLDLVEIPFRGRTVTYPAYHFVTEQTEGDTRFDAINAACEQLKSTAGFKFVIVMSADANLEVDKLQQADLVLTPSTLGEVEAGAYRLAIKEKIRLLWERSQV